LKETRSNNESGGAPATDGRQPQSQTGCRQVTASLPFHRKSARHLTQIMPGE
jgi:hypothetical protein